MARVDLARSRKPGTDLLFYGIYSSFPKLVGGADVEAYFYGLDWQPRVALEYDYASGKPPHSDGHGGWTHS